MADDNCRSQTRGASPAVPPPVAPAFHWTTETWGAALRARSIEPHAQHLFTTAQLRLPADASAAERARAWSAVAAALGVSPDQVLRVRQVHGRSVRIVAVGDPAAADPSMLPEGDAVVSNVAGMMLAVIVADCVPILLVDPQAGAAAAVHAGWRGTCAGVVRAAIDAMASTWGTDPRDLLAAIGPSIGPADYPVGESVVDAFRDAGHARHLASWFPRHGGRLTLDLWQATVDQLREAGVAADRIVTCGLSTFAHPSWLESYRRDGALAGRLIAAVVVPRRAVNQPAF